MNGTEVRGKTPCHPQNNPKVAFSRASSPEGEMPGLVGEGTDLVKTHTGWGTREGTVSAGKEGGQPAPFSMGEPGRLQLNPSSDNSWYFSAWPEGVTGRAGKTANSLSGFPSELQWKGSLGGPELVLSQNKRRRLHAPLTPTAAIMSGTGGHVGSETSLVNTGRKGRGV